MINILVKVNGLFHVLFNRKNEFIGIGPIQQWKSTNRTEAARIKFNQSADALKAAGLCQLYI